MFALPFNIELCRKTEPGRLQAEVAAGRVWRASVRRVRPYCMHLSRGRFRDVPIVVWDLLVRLGEGLFHDCNFGRFRARGMP
jgi:hypothetical protein